MHCWHICDIYHLVSGWSDLHLDDAEEKLSYCSPSAILLWLWYSGCMPWGAAVILELCWWRETIEMLLHCAVWIMIILHSQTRPVSLVHWSNPLSNPSEWHSSSMPPYAIFGHVPPLWMITYQPTWLSTVKLICLWVVFRVVTGCIDPADPA